MDGLRDFLTVHQEALKGYLDFLREGFAKKEAIDKMQKTLDMDRYSGELVVGHHWEDKHLG